MCCTPATDACVVVPCAWKGTTPRSRARARVYSPFFPYFLRFNVIIYRHRQRKTETGRCKFCSSHLPFSLLIFDVVEKNASRGMIIRKWMLPLFFFFSSIRLLVFVICRCTTQTILTNDCINTLLLFTWSCLY